MSEVSKSPARDRTADQPPAELAAKRESEFFDAYAREKGDFNPFAARGWSTLSRSFAKMVPSSHPLEVLDIGCGTGQSRQIYADKSRRYVGLDLSAESIERARRKFPQSTWVQGDARSLPLPDNSFDLVAFSSVLHHIDGLQQPLCEARRVLRPGGFVFAFDPNLLHPAMALFRHPKSPLYSSKGVSPNECPLLPKTLRTAFRQAAFVNVAQRCQANIPYRSVAPRLLNALLGFYNACDWLMEVVGLGRWFGVFVLTAGRKPEN